MKLKFKAVGKETPTYSMSGETVNDFDLSVMEHGDKFIGGEETGKAGIRDVVRDADGELWVTLCQEVGPGHWSESDWIDADDYALEKVYVKMDKEKSYSGRAWAKTINGKEYIDGRVVEEEIGNPE